MIEYMYLRKNVKHYITISVKLIKLIKIINKKKIV